MLGLNPRPSAARGEATFIRPPAVVCQKLWRRYSPHWKISRDEVGFRDWMGIWAPH